MALSKNSKILVSDISSALDNKLSLSGGELTGTLTARTYSNTKAPHIDVTEIPSEAKYGGGYVAYDKNNKTMFGLSFSQWPNGTNVLNIGVSGKSGTENTYLSFREDTDNNSILMFDEKHIVRSVNGVGANVAGAVNIPTHIVNNATTPITIPSGGTWVCVHAIVNTDDSSSSSMYNVAGGSVFNLASPVRIHSLFAIRIA